MKRSLIPSLFLLTAAMAACADDPLRPEVARPEFARVTTDAAHDVGYVVEFKGRTPADFEARVAALGGRVNFAIDEIGFASVSGLDERGARRLGAGAGINAVYPDVQVQLNTRMQPVAAPAITAEVASVNNPAGAQLFFLQWNMHAVNAPAAWAAGELGAEDVTIAILDTGIDYNNLDMNGIVDVTRSVSFVPSDDAYMAASPFAFRQRFDDLNGHGTNVAAQAATNGTAFAGVNSKTKLISVKVLGRQGRGSTAAILAGLIWAAQQDADVANLSIGLLGGLAKSEAGPQFVGLINRVFNYANQQGMVIVVAAGNDGVSMDGSRGKVYGYCSVPHVICVSATGPTAAGNPLFGPWVNPDALADFSNYGNQVTVAAPGGSDNGFVLSLCARLTVEPGENGGPDTFPCLGGGSVIAAVGTSQAAPHVAGLAARLVEIHGRNNPVAVKKALIDATDDVGTPGQDPLYGYGRINVAKAHGL